MFSFLCCFCLNSSLQRKLFFNIGFFGIFISFFNIFQDCLFIPVQKYIKINILEIQYELVQNEEKTFNLPTRTSAAIKSWLEYLENRQSPLENINPDVEQLISER